MNIGEIPGFEFWESRSRDHGCVVCRESTTRKQDLQSPGLRSRGELIAKALVRRYAAADDQRPDFKLFGCAQSLSYEILHNRFLKRCNEIEGQLIEMPQVVICFGSGNSGEGCSALLN